jgi:hypothetical protein
MARDAHVVDRAAIERQPAPRNDLLYAGAVGGLFAGAAMMGFAVVAAVSGGLSPSRPLELVAATFVGRAALDGGANMLLAGALLWAAVSAALGLLYAALVPREFPFSSSAMMGVGYSLFLVGIMTSAVLPRVNPVMRAEMPEMGGAWVLAYAVFGVALGVIPSLRRRMIARSR